MNRTAKDIFGFLGDRLITRGEAVRKINQIISRYRIMDDDKKALLEIIYCIEAEKDSWLHVWGGDPEEAALLTLSPQSNVIIDYDKEKLKQLYITYRFSPSASDKKEKKLVEDATLIEIEKKMGELRRERGEQKDIHKEIM